MGGMFMGKKIYDGDMYPSSQNEEKAWYVVETKQHKEYLAKLCILRNLHTKNTKYTLEDIYLPIIRQNFFKKKHLTMPLFPQYVFVHVLHSDLPKVRYTEHVKDLVRFGEDIPVLPSEIISELRSREIDGIIELKPKEINGNAIIKNGAWRGVIGKIVNTATTASERVSLLIEILGRQLNITVPARNIELQTS
jgi:transcription antitermination factor NusG